MLTWPGALIHIGLFIVVGVASVGAAGRRSESSFRLGACLTFGGLGAAFISLPFVLRSIWTASNVASYEGLSWLQLAALLALSLAGSLLALGSGHLQGDRWKILAPTCLSTVALMLLLPTCLPALLAGMSFLGRSEPWLQSIAESRPLLSLLGEPDLRPLLVRLSLIPLLLPILGIWLLKQGTERIANAFLLAWAVFTLLFALFQARYSHGAAFAMAAVAAFAMDRWSAQTSSDWLRRRVHLLVALTFVPCLAAYLPVPGFAGLRLFGRPAPVVASGMNSVCLFLRSAAPPPSSWKHPERPAEESVLGPWSAGHWIEWIGQKATIASPFGSHGQPSFHDAVGFYFLEDDAEIAALLDRRRVRWVVVESDLLKLEHAARMAAIDPEIFLAPATADGRQPVRLDRLMTTIGARLAFAGDPSGPATTAAPASPPGFHEVYRTPQQRQGPFGPVPFIRVYEIDRRDLLGDGRRPVS